MEGRKRSCNTIVARRDNRWHHSIKESVFAGNLLEMRDPYHWSKDHSKSASFSLSRLSRKRVWKPKNFFILWFTILQSSTFLNTKEALMPELERTKISDNNSWKQIGNGLEWHFAWWSFTTVRFSRTETVSASTKINNQHMNWGLSDPRFSTFYGVICTSKDPFFMLKSIVMAAA